jgi:primase-polymerase (primpol)-like protein
MNQVKNPSKINTREMITVCVAVIIVGCLGWFIYYMTGKAGVEDTTTWDRLVYLLTAVEAIAFTAIGFLFGEQVNKRAIDHAEENVNEAKKKVIMAKEKAAELQKTVEEEKEIITEAVSKKGQLSKEESNKLQDIEQKRKEIYREFQAF